MTRMATADLKAMRKHAGAAAAMLRALSHEARLLVLCELRGVGEVRGEVRGRDVAEPEPASECGYLCKSPVATGLGQAS